MYVAGQFIIRQFKMEEVQPYLSNGASKEVSYQNLTIPSEDSESVIPAIGSSGGIYKYGLTLEELFNLSLDYYKKGTTNTQIHDIFYVGLTIFSAKSTFDMI